MRFIGGLAAWTATAVVLLVTAAAAGADNPGATVAHVTWEGQVAVNCGESLSEVVDVTGDATYVMMNWWNANERYHLATLTSVRGSGVGETTGATYRVFVSTTDLGNSGMTHMDGRISLIGTGAAANYRWTEQFHTQINALGEVVVFQQSGDGVCR